MAFLFSNGDEAFEAEAFGEGCQLHVVVPTGIPALGKRRVRPTAGTVGAKDAQLERIAIDDADMAR